MLTRWALCALLVASTLAGCTAGADDPVRLTVLADRELGDLAPLLADLRRDTGIDLALDLRDSRDVEVESAAGAPGHDLAWVGSEALFRLRAGRGGPGPLSTSTMVSPVVVGLRPAAARRLRAVSARPGWADVADRVAAGELRLAVPDPHRSDVGLTALLGLATAAAGTGQALRAEDVTCDRLAGLRSGQEPTGPDPAAEFAASADRLDGVVDHESALLMLNASGSLGEPLELVYPRDGVVLSDFPLLLLDPGERAAYDRVVAWLLDPAHQRRIMSTTARRPVDPAVPRERRLSADVGTGMFLPGSADVLDRLLAVWDQPTTAHVVFVLDFSLSMAGERAAGLRSVFSALSGTGTGGFARFHPGETLTVVRFAGQPLDERSVTVRGQPDLDRLAAAVAPDDFGRNTAIWSAVRQAYDRNPTSVVLVTDGENNAGISADDLLAGLPRPAPPLFAVRIGAADPVELRRVAEATGGALVDATGGSLLNAVRGIRGC
ncbi:VWA domain-containing protein [Actinokineospora sp. PR83]|uniref:vWA domain-containing protein n=1 Tax=Actinokineospora sp. PR83 TaxID=2884908 RepID=UPI0027DF52EC|nr:vWA domain-containing protein [Actinokineospora sp. PR83]MCG8916519.1 VWA domain-containing protein [Actinokineospora sp. PR83]